MHDALNAIDPRYESYTVIPAASAGASVDAAVATAARNVLVAAAPAQAAAVNAKYAEVMGDHRPARAIVPVKDLHFDTKIEIQAIAAKP